MAVDQVTERWRADEASVRARLIEPDAAPRERVAGAVGCAIHSTLPAGKGFTTLELKVNMIRPLNDGVPLVRAEGRIIHAGRQVATAEGRIVGPDGRLYAHATTTCLIFEESRTKTFATA